MKRLKFETLRGVTSELASYQWRDEELAELVEPKLGLITGYQDMLDGLEQLRKVDLGAIAPAGPVERSRHRS